MIRWIKKLFNSQKTIEHDDRVYENMRMVGVYDLLVEGKVQLSPITINSFIISFCLMPYKSAEARREYYHRHQKFYQKDWIAKNRDKWNEYQRNRKRALAKLAKETKGLCIADNDFYQLLCDEEIMLSELLADIRKLKQYYRPA